jgi:hypothetical protein
MMNLKELKIWRPASYEPGYKEGIYLCEAEYTSTSGTGGSIKLTLQPDKVTVLLASITDELNRTGRELYNDISSAARPVLESNTRPIPESNSDSDQNLIDDDIPF